VHGFNTSFEEARWRAGQIAADSHFGGVPILFTWPSRGELLGYASDKDSATASRDALEQLLEDLARTPGLGRVHILVHSMGCWLSMEALRQIAIAGNRDLSGHLGEVMLAAPDIDLDVFASQMARIRPAKVTVFVTANDRALSLSSWIAEARQRVGAIDPAKPEERAAIERLGARVYDLSAFSDGLIGHGLYADTPDVIHAIGAQLSAPRAQEINTVSVIDAMGSDSPPDAAAGPAPTAPATIGATPPAAPAQ
jgi:esterase/lipase superfamily enzyme